MTQKFAVIGDPVAHSLSPVMQNAAFRELQWDAMYRALRVPDDELETFADFARLELAGFNVTVPHKHAIIPFLDSISGEAKIAQSVNTVTVRNGQLHGDTTDGFGLASAVYEAFGHDVRDSWIVFLGCGGAVYASAVHFAGKGAKYIGIINRTPEKAAELAGILRRNFPSVEVEYCASSNLDETAAILEKGQIVIQATRLGLNPEDPSPVPAELLPDGICCYDTVYKDTAFKRAARERGLRCASGLEMLLWQGVKSLEIWTGCRAPVEVMRKALMDASQTAQ